MTRHTFPIRSAVLASAVSLFGCAVSHSDQLPNKQGKLAVVEGSGESLEKAKDSALLAAVEAVNGMRMTASSRLTNEDLREQSDKYSAGHVESFELLKTSTLPDGTWVVAVAAWVKREKVESAAPAIAPAHELNVANEADNIRAQVLTRAKEQEQATIFVKNAIRSIGPHCIDAKFVAKLDAAVPMRERGEEDAPEQTWLKCQVAVGMYRDKKAVGGPVAALRDLLGDVALKRHHFGAQETATGVQLVHIHSDGRPEAYTQTIKGLLSISWKNCTLLRSDTPVDVVMIVKRDGSGHHEFDSYALPSAVWDSIANELDQMAQSPLALRLGLQDKREAAITILEVPIDSRLWGWSARRHGVAQCRQSVQLESGRSRVLLLGENVMFFQDKEGHLLAENELVMDLRFQLPAAALQRMDRLLLECVPTTEASIEWRDKDINRVDLRAFGGGIGFPCRANLHLVETGSDSGIFLIK